MRAGGAGFGGGASAVGAIRNIAGAITVGAAGSRTIRLRSAAIDYGGVSLPSRKCIRPPIAVGRSGVISDC